MQTWYACAWSRVTPTVEVNCVPRLSDALACLEVETPSLVLLDLDLPDSHGADTFRRDHAEGSECAGGDPFGAG